MADMKITESIALTRGLDQFRHLDQQGRAQAERVAAQAAERELIEHRKSDVEESERSVADKSDGGSSAEYHGRHADKEKKEEPNPPPETTEGRLIDLKA